MWLPLFDIGTIEGGQKRCPLTKRDHIIQEKFFLTWCQLQLHFGALEGSISVAKFGGLKGQGKGSRPGRETEPFNVMLRI